MAKNTLKFLYEENLATISDKFGNFISFGPFGISIESRNDILINVSGNVIVSADNIMNNANFNFSAKGGSLKINSTGITDITGTIVKIN